METRWDLSLNRVLAVIAQRWTLQPRYMTQKITVTILQACELTGLGRSTIYRLFDSGELQRLKSGSRTLIKVADLEAYIESLALLSE